MSQELKWCRAIKWNTKQSHNFCRTTHLFCRATQLSGCIGRYIIPWLEASRCCNIIATYCTIFCCTGHVCYKTLIPWIPLSYHFEHQNDVTIIIKLHKATHLRLVAPYKSWQWLRRHFYVQNVIEHRFSWNKCRLFHTNPKACTFYLVTHMVIWVV